MSKLVITILFIWISSLAISQTTFNITYDRTVDTVQNQSDWAYFNAVLTNPSSVDSVNIRATLLNKNTPFGWSVYLCPSTGCLAYFDTTASVLIAPLQTDTFLIKVWTDVMAIGNGDFTMRFENELDTTDFINTTLFIRYVPVIVGIEENESQNNYLSQNYPNPFDKTTTINYKMQTLGGEIVVFDMYGRKIKEYSLIGKEGKVIINENLSSGIYFYSLRDQNKIIETKKFIVQSNVNVKP
tara:strand:- start:1725 stop:2447 length:723 start_codon:yes stop_codon:yes gene_type:complete